MDHTRLRAPLGETLVRQYWTTLKSGNMSQLEMWCAKGFSPLIGVEWTYLTSDTLKGRLDRRSGPSCQKRLHLKKKCPLSGVKRTFLMRAKMSACDPKRTFSGAA
jgi:hypothetical protein